MPVPHIVVNQTLMQNGVSNGNGVTTNGNGRHVAKPKSIVQKTCPHLGLPDDSETAMAFSSDRNYCHHVLPITPVNNSFQSSHCLTNKHTTCPIFMSKTAVKRPRKKRKVRRKSLVKIIRYKLRNWRGHTNQKKSVHVQYK